MDEDTNDANASGLYPSPNTYPGRHATPARRREHPTEAEEATHDGDL